MPESRFTLTQLQQWCGGRSVGNIENVAIDRVVIDSRGRLDGALFVALKGDRFDGHDFVSLASSGGACAVLVEREIPDMQIPQLIVGDSLLALQQMARAHRRQFRGKVLAVTGSCGKTTTRTLLSRILSVKNRVHQPIKNFNNHIGVPLTLLELHDGFDMAVMELGCSNFGEIAVLSEFSAPDVALVTNVGPAHLEKLIDLEGVARAKGELFAAMGETGMVAVNIDDPHVAAMTSRAAMRRTYGESAGADVRLLSREATLEGQALTLQILSETVKLHFSLPGYHNALDAVAAIAAASLVGATIADIEQGLARAESVPGRLSVLKSNNGVRIIDDTYNANPSSTKASLETLCETKVSGRRIAVLGDMLELGRDTARVHMELGREAGRMGLDALVVVGELAANIAKGALAVGMPAEHCHIAADHRHAIEIVTEISKSGDALLIKGSRGMKMETIVQAIIKGQ